MVVPILQLCSMLGPPAKYSSFLDSDSFPHPSSLHLFFVPFTSSFLCHFHLYCHFVSPLPFPSLFTILLFFFPPLLCFLLFHIGSFSVLTLLLRHFSSHPSSFWFSTKGLYPPSKFQCYWIVHCSHLLPLLVPPSIPWSTGPACGNFTME